MSKISTARVVSATEYGYENGFIIEAADYRYGYSVPAWEEMGYGPLAGRFSTKEAAEAALANERSWCE